MNLGDKLKLLREEKGETQQQTSKKMGMAISSLRNYEGGKLPETAQIKKLKNYYGVTYEYLLDDECENKTINTINIGKELMLSETAINKIKSLQGWKIPVYSSDNLIGYHNANSALYKGLPEAFNDFLESNFDFRNLIFRIKSIQLCKTQYKKCSLFLYFISLRELFNDKNQKELIFSYYDTLMQEIDEIQQQLLEESINYKKFTKTYIDYKEYCLNNNFSINDSLLSSNTYDFTDYICNYLDSINVQLGFEKYHLNECISSYLGMLLEDYQIDDFWDSKSCFDDTLKNFLKKLNKQKK